MSSSPTQALCLLALVVIVTIGAASAAKPLPGSCLVAASTLCADADTNAMRCLTKLAIAGDARVPAACAEAVMAGVTVDPRRLKHSSRVMQLSRMLTEGGNCDAANTCPTSLANVPNQRCNDVQSQLHTCLTRIVHSAR